MATTYVCLLNWTQRGIENVKQSAGRLDAAREAFEAEGATLKDFYLTVGAYDMICVAEAPDDATVAKVLLKIGSQGNVRTTTLRAFPEARAIEFFSALGVALHEEEDGKLFPDSNTSLTRRLAVRGNTSSIFRRSTCAKFAMSCDGSSASRMLRTQKAGIPVCVTVSLLDGLARNGVRTLRNDNAVVATPAGPVAVGGIDDPHLQDTVLPNVGAVRPNSDDAVVHLGLVHAPYTAALDLLVDAGHDLLLAGHTHGGQVRVPGVGALVCNCDLPLRQARGVSRYGAGLWLHVSAGAGQSLYAPFRFACPPEATLLHLVPA